ncbi:Squamous cell carcinoma antigen recognized by T-cells 3 [Holothuria leucospilota]|uniref:Squamous cell carcinoma antigen recognized by T-cells 3 n=1 Tax=Holothuria leucospilota TaxID=206669 RepID=A0A9Q0Y981_HOLLE|nr:Squamous cell carcinoma antigen recognized by T-cells 3 [Holothuria leucospilota]
MDREAVEGRPMYIDRYVVKEKQKPATKDFKYEMKMEKNKLFVSNLPRSATKEELKKLFGQYGQLKEVRVVTYRSGVPKGLAYVEFENEVDASKAIIGTDGTNIGGHNICVAISNPPSRKQPISERKENEKEGESKPAINYPKSLGAKGVSGPRGKGRTQLSMMPRSLQRNTVPQPKEMGATAGKEPQQQSPSEGDKPKMSNADFAKMFLKS